MTPIKEIKANGKTLQIFNDESPESPREWDNMAKFICFHKRYNLGDKHDYSHGDYSGWAEMQKDIEKKEDTAIIKPLYMYDHSGITISTTPFGDPWDSGQIGFVVVSRKAIRECFSAKRVTKSLIARAEGNLNAEVKTYDQYLRGEVYGFKVIEKNGEESDSCWGFFGTDFEKNGLIDHAGTEFSEQKQAA